jgi:hypothetical protein
MQIESSKEKSLVRLDTIASEINEKYGQAERLASESVKSGNAAVIAAIHCGELLRKAKKVIGHGGWENWVLSDTQLSVDTAQRWMRLAKTARVLDLSDCKTITDAYRACSILPPLLENNNGTGTHTVNIIEQFKGQLQRPLTKLKELLGDYDLSAIPTEVKQEFKRGMSELIEGL